MSAQLTGLDGVLVWVNPIQDGANRALLDPLLRMVSSQGVWVSAHPDVILKLGTKEVLFHTRDLGWGSDTDLYRDAAAFQERFPRNLAKDRVRVLKQARGNGGNGVWKVALVETTVGSDPPGPDALVRVRHAAAPGPAASERVRLGDFFERCEEYFAWSGSLIDQTFQARLADGMVRCYLVQDEVVGFCRQWPTALLDLSSEAEPQPAHASIFEGPDSASYRSLKHLMEGEWVPQMQLVLGLDSFALPAIWDADFLFGPKTETGEDTYVLCEINASAVWPVPEPAVEKLARLAVARAATRRATATTPR